MKLIIFFFYGMPRAGNLWPKLWKITSGLLNLVSVSIMCWK